MSQHEYYIFLVGNRGVGKSSLIKRIQNYLVQGQSVWDLDQFIQERTQKKISDIFKTEGEKHFRQLEETYFAELLLKAKKGDYIALGAGFNLELIPNGNKVIWVQRKSDQHGRIFFDRPRLESNVTPLEEYHIRRLKREPQYLKKAWQTYNMPEGISELNKLEKEILNSDLKKVRGMLTILPHDLSSEEIYKYYFDKKSNWGIDYFEVRDDLLSSEQIDLVEKYIPKEKILYSVRKSVSARCLDFEYWDWPLELGECPFAQAPILSLHERDNKPVELLLTHFSQYQGSHLKLAIEIHDFDELVLCHNWQSEDPFNRSFLPRSHNGRWSWYRLYQKGRQKINFFREGFGSALDQPTLFEWQSSYESPDQFAAVLGHPVDHSHSPSEHQNYFSNRAMPFWSIDIKEGEWESAIKFLNKIGLNFAAVTSPLKKKAYLWVEHSTEIAQKFESVNTLVKTKNGWYGENTDAIGFDVLAKELSSDDAVVVWGGGGTKEAIRNILPKASFYSSTSGFCQLGSDVNNPKAIIWAAPRGDKMLWPNPNWKPDLVIDLNYREDSAGREYAQKISAKYISGLAMFKAQAKGQREYFEYLISQELI